MSHLRKLISWRRILTGGEGGALYNAAFASLSGSAETGDAVNVVAKAVNGYVG